MAKTEDRAQITAVAIGLYEQYGEAYGKLAAKEMELEADRASVKHQAIRRLIDTGAASSATAAEKIVETDEVYAAYLYQQRETVLAKNAAFTRMTSERLRAELGIALVRTTELVGV